MKKNITLYSLLLLHFFAYTAYSQCITPTNLQSVTIANSATFTWDAVPGAQSYTIDFKYTVYGWDNIEYSETVTTNSLTLHEIMQSVDLHWRVIANCGANGTSGYNQANFSTPCALPINLSTTNITTNSATINWQAPPELGNEVGGYIYAYRPAGVGASWIPLGQSTNLSFNLSNLQAGTVYEWCVNQICPYYTSAPAIATFTTVAAPCGVASLWLPNQITSSQANLRWLAVPNAVDYIVEYKPTNSQNWVTINSPTIEKLITGLTPSTQYDWRIKAICPSNNIGVYSGTGQFTTAAVVVPPTNCGVPTNLNITNIGNKSATFNWSPVPNATSYTLNYKLATNAGWLTVTGITNNSYTRTNLQIGANYIYKVRATCASGNGTFSSDNTFSTLNCVSAGNNSNEWIDRFNIGTINRISGAEPGGYVATGLTTDLNIGSTNNQGIISAGFSANTRNQNYSVFIDFNRNGNYNDPGERVYGIGGFTNAGNYSFSINIPSTATSGPAGLRVVMSRNGQPTNGPCLENFEGETEDYIVNLIAPTSRLSAENETVAAEFTDKLSVYPNPSNGHFKVKIPEHFNPDFYKIVNLTGSLVNQKNLANTIDFEIDLTHEPAGLYFINVSNKAGKNLIGKIWKQ